MRAKRSKVEQGFSLIEMLIAVMVFTIVTGILFRMLDMTQQRYRMESQVLDSFQGARMAMDEMTRDIHVAGYPPANQFTAAVVAASPQKIAFPFAWSPSYPATPCTVNVNCAASGGPSAYDLIIEADIDPQNNNGIEWVRYRLNGTTLERGVATKVAGADPELSTAPNMVEYVSNVINNAPAATMTSVRNSYPTMFPGNTPVPVFTYALEGGGTTPDKIREVNITLIVMSQDLDPKTGQPRVVTLTGHARRMNP